MEYEKKYRLVTRSNFDGIVNTALLLELGIINEICYVQPRQIQDGSFPVSQDDIVTNLPYVTGVHMAFDHRLDLQGDTKLNDHHALFSDAASVSEVIWEYYGGEKRFGKKLYPLVEAANRSKKADFTEAEIRDPKGWDQLIFLTDPRSGLGRFRDFRISNYALMQKLPALLLEMEIDDILNDPDVKARIALCEHYHDAFIEQLQNRTEYRDGIATLDLREVEKIYPGNRFMLYALFPDTKISIHIFPSKKEGESVFALGKSIFHKNHPIDLHQLLAPYGGGGHAHAATCQVPDHQAAHLKDLLLAKLQKSETI
jgi:hypothetical protein